MKQFLHKNRIWISLVLFFLIIAPSAFWGMRWIGMRLDSGKEEIVKSELARDVRAEQIKGLEQFRKQEKLIKDKATVLAIFLENTDEAKVQLADRIDTIASQENLTVEISAGEEVLGVEREEEKNAGSTKSQKSVAQDRGTKTGAQSEEEPVEESFVVPAGESYITLTITMTGRFSDVTRFLHKIEHMEYFNDVLTISLNKTLQRQSSERVRGESATTQEKEENVVKATMEVIFYLK